MLPNKYIVSRVLIIDVSCECISHEHLILCTLVIYETPKYQVAKMSMSGLCDSRVKPIPAILPLLLQIPETRIRILDFMIVLTFKQIQQKRESNKCKFWFCE